MSLKIYLCDKIEWLPYYNAELDANNEIVPKTGKAWTALAEASGQFTEESQDTDAGLLVTQKLEANCELSAADSNIICMTRQLFRLRFSDGTTHIWGSLEYPALCNIKGSKLQKTLSAVRQTTALEF